MAKAVSGRGAGEPGQPCRHQGDRPGGAETAVSLGGGGQPPPEDGVGPILLRPMQRRLLAFDGEGKIIGSSERPPISP